LDQPRDRAPRAYAAIVPFPSPDRRAPPSVSACGWRVAAGLASDATGFLAAHWDGLAAADFFTVDVLTVAGLVRYVVLFVMKLKTRTVEIAGLTSQPDGSWMTQVARNLTDADDGSSAGWNTSFWIATRCTPPSYPHGHSALLARVVVTAADILRRRTVCISSRLERYKRTVG
jgi:hypothetical protein